MALALLHGPDGHRRWADLLGAMGTRNLVQVRALGMDERFIRKWSYYLDYCGAAFAMRNISVVQTLHTRANNISF